MGLSRIVVLVLSAALQVSLPAWAGGVTMTAAERGMIIVVADYATIDDVLTLIGKRFGFTVERISPEPDTKLVSGRFAGTPDGLVAQMLRGQGHVLVRQADAPAGIERIFLLGSRGPVAVAAMPPFSPPATAAADPTSPVTLGKPSPRGSYAGGTPMGAPSARLPDANAHSGPSPGAAATPARTSQ